MKKFVTLLLSLLMLFTACASKQPNEEKVPISESKPADVIEETSQTVILYGDCTFGAADAKEDVLTAHTVTIEGTLSAVKLAEALSQWSGLDFKIQPTETLEDSIAIDWAETSTLLSGEIPQEIKVGFHFENDAELCWFMLDSLAMTLQKNLGVRDVYYTMSGGEPLYFEKADIRVPQSEAYPGSSRLLMDRNRALARFSAGNWYLDGSLEGEYIERTNSGYVWYDGQGTTLSSGSVSYIGKTDSDWKLALVENSEEAVRYDLEFISESEFVLDGKRYVKKDSDPVSAFAETAGYWRYKGQSDTASMQMNGLGNYICYNEEGDFVAAGELEKTNAWTYQMIHNGEYIGSFEMISDSKLSMDGDAFIRYAEPVEEKLAKALRMETIRRHEKTFLTGIMEAAGWHVVDMYEQEGLLWVYAHCMFAEYDYKYGDFTMVREVQEPVLFCFNEINDEYDLWEICSLEEKLRTEEVEPYLAALEARGYTMEITAEIEAALEAMCDMEAQEYLYRDGSDAEIWRRN